MEQDKCYMIFDVDNRQYYGPYGIWLPDGATSCTGMMFRSIDSATAHMKRAENGSFYGRRCILVPVIIESKIMDDKEITKRILNGDVI